MYTNDNSILESNKNKTAKKVNKWIYYYLKYIYRKGIKKIIKPLAIEK